MSEPTGRRAFGYVPALDGVRALSLLAILVFHSHFPWARGGFLGVTVFFTLSGFLITSLLLTERERTGGIGLRAFWVRRARRLAPAVLVLFALVIVLMVTHVLARRTSVAEDALATAGWSANWRFLLSGQSYGQMFSQPTPFQHMWSLAVEEQFYLLFPGLLLLLLGRNGRLHRWRAGLVVLAGILLSWWLCAALWHPGAVERSYYGTDTRMAEPFVGVLLALVLTRGGAVRRLPTWFRWLLDVAAVGAIGVVVLVMHRLGQYDHTLYQGGFLLVAVCTAVVLASVTQPGSLLGRVLGLPPLAFVGKVSYGAYVFHWPVYLWLTPERTGLGPWGLLALRATVTFLAAVVSYAVVEEPVRLAKRFSVSLALPAWAASTTLALAVIVLASSAVTVSPSSAQASGNDPANAVVPPLPASPQATQSAAARATAAARRRGLATRVTSSPATKGPTSSPTATTSSPSAASGGGKLPAPRPKPANPLRIAVVGDSLADNLGGGLQAWARGVNTAVVDNLAIPACPLSRGGWLKWPDGYTRENYPKCNWWSDPSNARLQQFEAFDPQIVVLQDGMSELVEHKVDNWNTYRRAGDPVFDQWLLGEYKALLQVLNPRGTRKVMVLNAVCADWNQVDHFQGFQLELDSRITSLNIDYSNLSSETGVAVKDLRSNICPGGQYSNTVDGVSDARPDGYHLSTQAALAVATDWLGPLCIDAVKS